MSYAERVLALNPNSDDAGEGSDWTRGVLDNFYGVPNIRLTYGIEPAKGELTVKLIRFNNADAQFLATLAYTCRKYNLKFDITTSTGYITFVFVEK